MSPSSYIVCRCVIVDEVTVHSNTNAYVHTKFMNYSLLIFL